MIKFFIKFINILAFVAIVNINTFAKENNYIVLKHPIANANGTVIEVFSYDCPFCYKYDKTVFEPAMKKIKDIKFVPYHLSAKGAFGKHVNEIFATMMVLDESEGIDLLSDDSRFKKAKFTLYKEYHNNKQRWGNDPFIQTNVNDLKRTVIDAVNISNEEYEKAKSNPKVRELIEKWGESKSGDAYIIGELQGIPAFVVDGKYLIKIDSIHSIDHMVEIIRNLHSMK